eukprot:8436215-Pyramimonas_sp.AAC.1
MSTAPPVEGNDEGPVHFFKRQIMGGSEGGQNKGGGKGGAGASDEYEIGGYPPHFPVTQRICVRRYISNYSSAYGHSLGSDLLAGEVALEDLTHAGGVAGLGAERGAADVRGHSTEARRGPRPSGHGRHQSAQSRRADDAEPTTPSRATHSQGFNRYLKYRVSESICLLLALNWVGPGMLLRRPMGVSVIMGRHAEIADKPNFFPKPDTPT